MSAITFDTLDYSKKAKAHGFTEEQAEFQAEEMAKFAKSIDGELVTKQDMERSMKELEERLLYKLTTRLGSIIIAAVTVLGILVSILHR